MEVALFSSQPDYLRVASAALADAIPNAEVEPLGPDVAALATDVTIDDVARVCQSAPIPFVRHLARERIRVSPDDAGTAAVVAAHRAAATELNLQVWTSGNAGVRAEGLRALLAEQLEAADIRTSRRGGEQTLAVCATERGVSLGITPTSSMLCDWPGGRVRLRAGPDQISRSEFKLEELVQLFPLARPRGGRALDHGATPGGWTRVLRTFGLEVVAVDPGDLDRRLARDSGIRHVRTTAGRYLQAPDGHFDLVVNDMRMEPARSAQIVSDATTALGPRALAVVTLKVTPRRARVDVETALERLQPRYELLFARQLHHNRNEVTLVLRLRSRP